MNIHEWFNLQPLYLGVLVHQGKHLSVMKYMIIFLSFCFLILFWETTILLFYFAHFPALSFLFFLLWVMLTTKFWPFSQHRATQEFMQTLSIKIVHKIFHKHASFLTNLFIKSIAAYIATSSAVGYEVSRKMMHNLNYCTRLLYLKGKHAQQPNME